MTNLKSSYTFIKLWRIGFAKNTGGNKPVIEQSLAVHYPETPEGKWIKVIGRIYWQQTKTGYLDL